MKKIKILTNSILLLFITILISCESPNCSDFKYEDGKAVIFANSTPRSNSGNYYNTAYRFIDSNCKCKEVKSDITVESYSVGDTVYVKSNDVIGSY